MATIIPRWEWRTFGSDFKGADQKIMDLGPSVKKSGEKYILSRNSSADQFSECSAGKLFAYTCGKDLLELTLDLCLECQYSISLRLLSTYCCAFFQNCDFLFRCIPDLLCFSLGIGND